MIEIRANVHHVVIFKRLYRVFDMWIIEMKRMLISEIIREIIMP
jgi:hypothetical protein